MITRDILCILSAINWDFFTHLDMYLDVFLEDEKYYDMERGSNFFLSIVNNLKKILYMLMQGT